jgi:hypothetical protein
MAENNAVQLAVEFGATNPTPSLSPLLSSGGHGTDSVDTNTHTKASP